ncbi:MAG TPA: cytidine deaminase [Aeromonadales bacterium]|nr:cytidine deaminase [Aeromonadales bacterium]
MASTDPMQQTLYRAALSAMQNAHAPYSRFKVGAAVLDTQGNIHIGCNVENAAYPEGICAEANAIGAMVSAGESEIKQICIVSSAAKAVPPCGGCRQKIHEFASSDTDILICGKEGVEQHFSIKELLPASFGAENLRDL